MGCNEYKLSRRAMMGATGASLLGLSIRDLQGRARDSLLERRRNVPYRYVGSEARPSDPG